MKVSLTLVDAVRRDLASLARIDAPSVGSVRRRYSRALAGESPRGVLRFVRSLLDTARARGGNGDAGRTLRVCQALLGDPDDMVVKAMSGSLRELAKQDPKSVETFLSKEEGRLSSGVKREVRPKLRS